MPVFALYNFEDSGSTAQDSALTNGAQNGVYVNGAAATDGLAVLDGQDDLIKIYQDPAFQLDRGTLDISFTVGDAPVTAPQTVLSRDSVGDTDGGYHIDLLPDGSVCIVHETADGVTTSFATPTGFYAPGDSLQLSYSWDEIEGGRLVINNTTTDATFDQPVPEGLTMDMSADSQNQPWVIGAGQSQSNPDDLDNISQYFAGTVETFSISDTVDNENGAPFANPDVAATDEDEPVTITVLANDSDPQNQQLTVTDGIAPNGSVVINADGTITYTPDPDFNGTDIITYTVTDPDGNTATSSVTVTVNPVNDAPVATDDTGATGYVTPVTLVVLGNDTDVDGDTLSVLGTPTSADGSVVVNGDGTITFTPNVGFTGEAVINYTVTDPAGATDDAVVRVTVAAPARDGIVTGTAAGELIDVTYTGDPDGDRIENNDALLPGEAPNDDIVRAGAGDDTIRSLTGDDDIQAGDGADVVEAGAGSDVVDGGLGGDTIDTGAGMQTPDRAFPGLNDADLAPNDDRDLVMGGEGNDTIRTGDDADTISGGAGLDRIESGVDADSVNGNDGADTIIAGEGSDSVAGDLGDDLIYGGADPLSADPRNLIDAQDPDADNDRDNLAGGTGNDTIYGLDDDDTISGGDGNDVLDGGFDDDLVTGGAGNDEINGGQGADTLTGNADRDTFIGVTAGDLIDGSATGDDVDTLDLRAGGPVRVTYDPANAENGTISFLDDAGNVTGTASFVEIENVLLPPTSLDGYVDGSTGGDLIDTAYLGDPNGDRVDANDALLPGDDLNDDRIRAGEGDDTVRAGLGDDSVVAGIGDDSVFGGVGDDTLEGGDGNDTLNGEGGNDRVLGGLGDDLIDTTGGGDAPLPDRGYPGLYAADATPLNDLDTVFGGDGNDTIRTGDDADFIDAGTGADSIDGGIDDDTIFGQTGADTIIGGEGSDQIDGGADSDLIYGGLDPAFPDEINIPDATDLRPDNGRDTILGGAGNDTIFGMDDDDVIDGGTGNDLLDGGIDDDTVSGGTGNDTILASDGLDDLQGGDDRDVFNVTTAAGGIGDVINGDEGGDDFDTLNLSGSGPLRIDYDPTNAENGTVNFLDTDGSVIGSLEFTNIENVVPCFTPGTMIATPKGEVPVESLRAGDKVITRDNGIQEIRWTGRKDLTWHDFVVNPHLKPILVRQGSLGNGLPERDMMVSPNHRMLVANDRTALYFDEHEVLVSAKHLLSGNGVHAVESIGTSYIHFMFDQHEVVLSNGAWTESFQPGDYTLKGMGNSQRNEIFELFPELKSTEGLQGYTAARRTLKRHEARLLVK